MLHFIRRAIIILAAIVLPLGTCFVFINTLSLLALLLGKETPMFNSVLDYSETTLCFFVLPIVFLYAFREKPPHAAITASETQVPKPFTTHSTVSSRTILTLIAAGFALSVLLMLAVLSSITD